MAYTYKPDRIEGTSVPQIADRLIAGGPYDKTLLAEGDSWFDLFTPLFKGDTTNLLGHVRTTHPSALVDISRIGDTAATMTSGWQRMLTRALLDTVPFDAWLLSVGGNDLKDAFADKVVELVEAGALEPANGKRADRLRQLTAERTGGAIQGVLAKLDHLVSWRNASKRNGGTPLFIHGYDHITPRNAPAFLFPNLPIKGPWIFPVLDAAKLTPAQMLDVARAVLQELNREFSAWAERAGNVHFVDLLGTLTPAEFADVGEVGDWADEIHPSRAGFAKLGGKFSTVLHKHGL